MKEKAEKEDKDDKEGDEEDDEDDDEDVLQCLVKLKPDMKNKMCRARVEHLQLLQLKNIQFSDKFKALCHADVIRRCTEDKPVTASKVCIYVVSCKLFNGFLLQFIIEYFLYF
jgi:hypothetical protein